MYIMSLLDQTKKKKISIMCFSATLERRTPDSMGSDRKPRSVSLGSAFVEMNERVSGVPQYTQRVATLSVSDRRLKSLSDHLYHRD